VFPIGGLVDIGETPITTGSRHYRQPINFVLTLQDRLCLFRILKRLNHIIMPFRISLYILDVKAECLTMLYFDMHVRRRLSKKLMMHSGMHNCSGLLMAP